jgi:hypothetical protein
MSAAINSYEKGVSICLRVAPQKSQMFDHFDPSAIHVYGEIQYRLQIYVSLVKFCIICWLIRNNWPTSP